MALYSVHILGDSPQSAAGAAFVRQSFNWKAFFFGPLWLLVHRLWAGLALWVAAYRDPHRCLARRCFARRLA